LTTKFTQHTAASPSLEMFVIPSNARNLLSFRPAGPPLSHHTPLKFHGPLILLLARLDISRPPTFPSPVSSRVKRAILVFLATGKNPDSSLRSE